MFLFTRPYNTVFTAERHIEIMFNGELINIFSPFETEITMLFIKPHIQMHSLVYKTVGWSPLVGMDWNTYFSDINRNTS